MRKTLLLALPALLLACVHLPPPPGSDEEARNFANLFLKALRWEGPRASAALLVPELQREYLDTIKAQKLEDRLKLTEYDLKELGRSSRDSVTVIADLNWYFEPDVTVHHEEATLDLTFRDGHWMVAGVEGGPLPIAPLGAPAPVDGGAP
jgi:hypothetical protein